MFDLIIKNGTVVLENQVKRCDIAVKDGKISKISDEISDFGTDLIDATGKVVMAGMIDSHFHASDPGGIRSDWEGYMTGTRALAKGGITTFLDMPLNNLPATVDKPTLDTKRANAKEKCYVDFGFFGGVMPNNQDKLKDLKENGAIAFKAFMSSCGDKSIADDFRNVNDYELFSAMQELSKIGGIMCVHAENAVVTDMLGIIMKNDGKKELLDYANSRPKWTETEAVARASIIAKATGARLHIMHVSNPDTIEFILNENKNGAGITFESCPHYLIFSHEDFTKYGTKIKCSPPIRSLEDKNEMWDLFLNGTIKILSSDHSPCPYKMKDFDNAFDAWGGISGAQNSLDLMFSEAVIKRNMDMCAFSHAISKNPAQLYGIKNKGIIKEGYDADLVIIDTSKPYTLTEDMLLYQNKFSPYVGFNIECTITHTILRGNVIYNEDLGVALQPCGKEVVHAV